MKQETRYRRRQFNMTSSSLFQRRLRYRDCRSSQLKCVVQGVQAEAGTKLARNLTTPGAYVTSLTLRSSKETQTVWE